MKNPYLSILLAEDDLNLGVVLSTYLRNKGFDILLCKDGREALDAFRTGDYNFVITDIMMPVMDGFELAKEIRVKNPEIPIVFLTAKTMEEDRLKGFKIGADDYILKPFSMDELLLRISAIARRGVKAVREDPDFKYSYKNIEFDYFEKTLFNGEKKYSLSLRDADLLRMLFQKENEAIERSHLLFKIWGSDNYFNSRNMDVYMTKFRSYLRTCPDMQILNIRGEGIKLVVNRDEDAGSFSTCIVAGD
jgi:DNA-binding response OmpR family regulator